MELSLVRSVVLVWKSSFPFAESGASVFGKTGVEEDVPVALCGLFDVVFGDRDVFGSDVSISFSES